MNIGNYVPICIWITSFYSFLYKKKNFTLLYVYPVQGTKIVHFLSFWRLLEELSPFSISNYYLDDGTPLLNLSLVLLEALSCPMLTQREHGRLGFKPKIPVLQGRYTNH